MLLIESQHTLWPLTRFCLEICTMSYESLILRWYLKVPHLHYWDLWMLSPSSSIHELRSKQKGYLKLEKIHEAKMHGRDANFEICAYGSLIFIGCWCMPNDVEFTRKILEEAHVTPYSVHPRGDKIYKDLNVHFWWPCMKLKIVEFVARCLVSQKEHWASEAWWCAAAIAYSCMEVWFDLNWFCDGFAESWRWYECDVGDCWPIGQGCSFYCDEDYLVNGRVS